MPPTDSIEGMDVQGMMLNILYMCTSSKGRTSARIRQAKKQAKEDTPHPSWLLLLRGCAPVDIRAKIPFDFPIRLRGCTSTGVVAQ